MPTEAILEGTIAAWSYFPAEPSFSLFFSCAGFDFPSLFLFPRHPFNFLHLLSSCLPFLFVSPPGEVHLSTLLFFLFQSKLSLSFYLFSFFLPPGCSGLLSDAARKKKSQPAPFSSSFSSILLILPLLCFFYSSFSSLFFSLLLFFPFAVVLLSLSLPSHYLYSSST